MTTSLKYDIEYLQNSPYSTRHPKPWLQYTDDSACMHLIEFKIFSGKQKNALGYINSDTFT